VSRWSTPAASAGSRTWASDRGSPISFTGNHLTVSVTDIDLEASLNPPLEMWLRYVSGTTGEERSANLGRLPLKGSVQLHGFVSQCSNGCEVEQLFVAGSSSSVTDATGSFTIAEVGHDGDPGDWRLDDSTAWRAARPFGTEGASPLQLEGTPGGLRVTVDQESASVLRLTTTDLPEAPPVVMTAGSVLDDLGRGTVNGASVLGARTPMTLATTTDALPIVGDNGGLSDLRAALREYGDESTNVTITELLVASGTPPSVLDRVEELGVDLSEVNTLDDELDASRSDAFSLGWRVFLLVGVLTLLLAFLGVLALAVVQLRWRSYEVAALRVVGVRRQDLRRAVVTEYVALLGMAVVGGVLAATASLLLVLPSMDIGERGSYDPAVDYGLRWLVMAGVLGLVLFVVLAIAVWIARRTVKLGTPATLRQADNR
jgi:putative ABC transport system permease protein